MKRHTTLSLCCLWLLVFATLALGNSLPNVKRILFLGDSITQDGRYVNYIEAVLLLETSKTYDIVNLGLSSETVSGLTESSSKTPRPVLFSRLNSSMKLTTPGLVFLCYGMNDGIYHPFSEARFDKFAAGIERARSVISSHKTSIIHISPPVFDALPIQQKLAPSDAKDFGYGSPSPNYDKALEIYSDRLNHQRRHFGWRVIDLHYAMKTSLNAKRKEQPNFTYAPDGVHPNDEGHWLMAQQVLNYWGIKSKASVEDFQAPNGKYHPLITLIKSRQDIIRAAYMNETAGIKLGKLEVLKIADARARAAQITEQISSEKLALEGKPVLRIPEETPTPTLRSPDEAFVPVQ